MQQRTRVIAATLLLLASLAFADGPLFCNTVDMNTTADQEINMGGYTQVAVRHITMSNASLSLTTARGGIYMGAAKTGVVIVPATQAYTTLTTATKYLDLTLNAVVQTNMVNGQMAYFSLTTPQGSAATARICIFGDLIN